MITSVHHRSSLLNPATNRNQPLKFGFGELPVPKWFEDHIDDIIRETASLSPAGKDAKRDKGQRLNFMA